MSIIKQIILIVFIGVFIYFFRKQSMVSNFIQIYSRPKTKQIEKFIENKEENEIQLKSPTLNPLEIRQIIKMKNSIVKPYTSSNNFPNNSQYKNISNLDFKNLQSYLANLLKNINVDGLVFNIIPTNISPNIYIAVNTNVAYLTPIELQGTLFVNNQKFGIINFNIILRGSTNTIYVPTNGVFFNNKKYEMYVESFNIISIIKDNSPEQKQKGFYATVDTIDLKLDEQQDFNNKTSQEIKIDRIANNPLTTLTELEDSENDFNLSEIIKNDNIIEPDSENVSSVNISY